MLQFLMLLAVMLSASLAGAQSPGLPDPKNELRGEALIRALKGGGYSLLFRHAVREPNVTERLDKIAVADCGTQIPLSAIGRAQSRSIGEAMRKLEIPLGNVIASPFCRAMDTARLIAGRVRAENAVAGRDPERMQDPYSFTRLREMVGTAPEPGTNRLIVGHVNAFAGVAGGPLLMEGEAGVFRANEGRLILIARLRAEDWQAYAAPANAPPPAMRSSAPDQLLALHGLPLVSALGFGGYTIYFRLGATDASVQRDTPSTAVGCSSGHDLPETTRAQARRIGEAVSAMRLPLNEVLGSDCYAIEAARLIARPSRADDPVRGVVRTVSAIDDSLLETKLATPPSFPGLRFIIGDGKRFNAVAGPPYLEEGEAAVLRTTAAGGWVVVARVQATQWTDLLEAAGITSELGD